MPYYIPMFLLVVGFALIWHGVALLRRGLRDLRNAPKESESCKMTYYE